MTWPRGWGGVSPSSEDSPGNLLRAVHRPGPMKTTQRAISVALREKPWVLWVWQRQVFREGGAHTEQQQNNNSPVETKR